MPLFTVELNRLADSIGASDLTIWLHTAAPSDAIAVFKERYAHTDPKVFHRTVTWRDNMWFTKRNNNDRLRTKREEPHLYDHVWEGAYDERRGRRQDPH